MLRACLVISACVVGILLARPVGAQGCPVEYGFQGSYNFSQGSKSYVSVRRHKDIAASVVNKINEQLKARVGESFFKRLRFDYGSAHDFDDARPLKANDGGRVDGYDFVFKFADRDKGLTAFYFKVVADSKGKLIDYLALPDIASDPQKADLIPCKQALAIAAMNGFPVERSSIWFIYDWDAKAFVWDVHDRQPVDPDEPTFSIGIGTYRKIFIEAHTGKVLKIFKETIVV